MDCHILGSLVWGFGEVASNLFCAFLHIVEVALEPVHESPLSLTHVLHFAYLARNTIYEVVGFAADIFHCVKRSVSAMAVNSACFVDQGAVPAPAIGTWGVTSFL